MASVLMLVGGAVVNAVAFSGSNYLFSKLRDKSVDEERIRHDKAVEKLQAAHAKWTENRAERLNWINEELRRQQHAVQTFQNVDDAMHEYNIVFGKKLADIFPEPKLSDFYMPSEDQKNREIVFVILGMSGVAVLAYKRLKL